MSDSAAEASAGEGAFNARTMLLVTAIGSLAFIAMLVLGAYAPDLRSGHNGGAHALSNAATGFSGLVRLAEDTGRNPRVIRSEHGWEWQSEMLMVVTPEDAATPLGDILGTRGARATLIVLPKWRTAPDKAHPGWVHIAGLLPPLVPEGVLAPAVELKIGRRKSRGEALRTVDVTAPAELRFLAPAVVQSMSGAHLHPLVVAPDGGILLAKVDNRPLYVLSDPDLINNHAMGSARQAASALALLDFLNGTGENSVAFDVTANGLGHSRSPLKLAFDAPFLAVTLILFAAMLLAAWQALVRFGPIRRRQRAIAFGKTALVENSAALIRKAGREARLGGRYADLIRERAVAMFGIAPTLDPTELDARVEALNPRRSFAAAAQAATDARSRDELLGAAKSLHIWLEEVQQ